MDKSYSLCKSHFKRYFLKKAFPRPWKPDQVLWYTLKWHPVSPAARQQFTFTNVMVRYACIADQDTPLFQANGSPSNTEHGLVTLVWHLRLATIWPLGD